MYVAHKYLWFAIVNNCILFSWGYTELVPLDLLSLGVKSVLSDPGFQVESVSAAASLRTAREFLTWIEQPQNQSLSEKFARNVVSMLENCFDVAGEGHLVRENVGQVL